MAESFGPDPTLFNPDVFNPTYFSFLNQPVSYSTLRSTAVINQAGVDSYIQSREINLAGVEIRSGDLQVNTDIIGNASTTITAGIAQIPNITTVSDNLIIQASDGNNIYIGYEDGNGDLYINTNTASNTYIDGGDLVLNSTNQKFRVGTGEVFFNETNKWSATELKSDKISINNIDLETKLTTHDLTIAQNKSESDAHFLVVDQTAEANKTQLETSITSVNATLTQNINTVNSNLTQQINTNQSLNDAHFLTVEQTAETNRIQLQTNIETVNTNLTNSINSVNNSLTQQITQNKSESDARFLTVESTAETNKSQLQTTINSVNSSLNSSINSVNSNLSQIITANKAESDAHFLTVENTAEENKTLLQFSIQTLDTKVDTHKSSLDTSISQLNTNKADITYVDTKITDLIGGAPTMLNTLNELAAAISNDNNFSSTIVSLVGTKADKTYTDSQDTILQNSINANLLYTNSQLDTKVNTIDYDAYKVQVSSDLNNKVNISDYNTQVSQLQNSINTKVSQTLFDASFSDLSNTKVDNTTFQTSTNNLQTQIDTKANSTYVDTQLALKANQSTVDTSFSTLQSVVDTKASSSYVDTQLALKSNQTDVQSSFANVQNQLDTKASSTYVDTQLALKANQSSLENSVASLQSDINSKASTSYVDQQLLLKVNTSDAQATTANLTSLINEKASTIYVDGQLAVKANKSYVDDQLATINSGILLKADKTYVDTKINDLIGSAPQTLDTLQEIANAIAEDANFSVTVINSIATKASKTYVDEEVSTLQSQINSKASTSYVDQQLDLKGDLTYIDQQLALKSNASDVTTALASKASINDLNNLNAIVNTKIDASFVEIEIADAKAYTDASIAGLASETFVNNSVQTVKSEILGGVSPAYDTLLELQNALQNNNDAVTAITNSLGTKASITYVDNAVSNLQSNIQSDLTNTYATQTYVNNQIAAIPPTDFTGYATETYVNNQISSIPPTDFTGYATETYVNTAIQNAQTGGVDLSNYAEKSVVDASFNAIELDISNNYALKTYVDSAVANVSVDLTGYATENYVTTAVSTATNEILGGAGAAFDTLNELKVLIDSGDASVSTALATQIAAKANDNEVVHLTGTETIGGIKTFSNNITVSSINNINATTLGYISNVTSDIQAQIDSLGGGGGSSGVDLTTTQTITGDKIWQNTNTFYRNIERLQNLALTGSSFTFNFTESSLGYVNPSSSGALTCNITNIPHSGANLNASNYTMSLVINAASFKTYVTTVTVNGTTLTVRFLNGSNNVNVTSANYILQTFNILSLPGLGNTLVVLSSVSQWF